jgi:hypothetical protein
MSESKDLQQRLPYEGIRVVEFTHMVMAQPAAWFWQIWAQR